MKQKEIINKNVHKKIDEHTILVEFKIDVETNEADIITPFYESWIWSNNISDLYDYLYELLIPEYLINALIIMDKNIDKKKDYSLVDAINKYKECVALNKDNSNSLNELNRIYNNRKNDYLDFIKSIIKLEKILSKIDISFKTISYANPYEARHSKSLKTDRFDYDNLEINFR